MTEEEKKELLKKLISEVDDELEKTGEHEITKRLELSRKKAIYNQILADDTDSALQYAIEFIQLDDELIKRLSIFYKDDQGDL